MATLTIWVLLGLIPGQDYNNGYFLAAFASRGSCMALAERIYKQFPEEDKKLFKLTCKETGVMP